MNPVSAFTVTVVEIIEIVLNLYIWVLVIGAILSWLVAFNVINRSNQFVTSVQDFIFRITEPALKPIRRILPPVKGIDLSPLILILILIFLQRFIARLVYF